MESKWVNLTGNLTRKYTIAVYGRVNLKAEVINEKATVSARGELVSPRNVLISLLTQNRIFTLTKHGFLLRWWEILDEDGNLVCRSSPGFINVSRMMYAADGKPKLTVVGWAFYDLKNEIIASIRSKGGLLSREYELETKQDSSLTNDVIILAIGMVLFVSQNVG